MQMKNRSKKNAQKQRTTVALLPQQASVLDVAVDAFDGEFTKGEIVKEAVMLLLSFQGRGLGGHTDDGTKSSSEKLDDLLASLEGTVGKYDIKDSEIDVSHAYIDEMI